MIGRQIILVKWRRYRSYARACGTGRQAQACRRYLLLGLRLEELCKNSFSLLQKRFNFLLKDLKTAMRTTADKTQTAAFLHHNQWPFEGTG